ncbi:hypothetical protein ACFLVJ_00980 [Chloroflexota bacterium]
MKTGRKILLVIVVGTFAAILISLGLVLFQLIGEQGKLKEQLALSQSELQGIQLEQLSSQQSQLEAQLSQTTSQFEAGKGMLSEPVSGITSASTIFEIARTYNLVVTEITSPGLAAEELEGALLSTILMTATVQGDVSTLVDFVTTLNSIFTTGVVRSVTITVPEGSGTDNATANVQLAVYTYRGD